MIDNNLIKTWILPVDNPNKIVTNEELFLSSRLNKLKALGLTDAEIKALTQKY